MTVSIHDLMKPATREEAKASIYAALDTVGVSTDRWRPGSVVRTIIVVVAILFSACAKLIAEIAKGGFLEYATGAWLTLRARQYGIARLEATFGTGTLTLTNEGGGIFDLDPSDLIVRNPITDRTYTNVSAVHLGAGMTATFRIIAQEAGSASTSGVGAITEFVTPLLNVTCSNPTAVVGTDAEDDEALRLRCSELLGARSANGPVDAYAFAMRSATRADGSAIGVNRVRAVKDGRGLVRFYVATPSGAVTAEDLAVVREAFRVAPEGVIVEALSAMTTPLNLQYRVWLAQDDGTPGAELSTKFLNAIARAIARVPVGGFVIDTVSPQGGVWPDDIEGAIRSVRPDAFRVEIVSPLVLPEAPLLPLGFQFVPVLGNVVALSIVIAPQRAVAA